MIAERIKTSNSHEDLSSIPGPSTSRMDMNFTPKLGKQYFDKDFCYAPAKECAAKKRIEFCETIIPVAGSPMSPPPHARGPTLGSPMAPWPHRLNLGSVFRTIFKTWRLMRT